MESLPNILSLEGDGEESFADVCISARMPETRSAILELENRIGFHRFCVNTEVDSVWTPRTGGKKKKGDDRESPQPACPVPHPKKSSSPLKDGCRVYSRLTFPLTDPIQLNKMATPAILAYDVIAVEPADEKLFHKVCTESENVELVTFNYGAGNAPGFKINPSIVKVAQERGIHFEINVSPGLRSSQNAKQHLISYARKIVAATKGKNVILSSGAIKPSEVRGPYDLMNLGVLFGMNQSQAKDAVSKNFSALLRHALTRKSGGGVVTFVREIHCSQKTKAQLAPLRKLKATIAAKTWGEKKGDNAEEKKGNQEIEERKLGHENEERTSENGIDGKSVDENERKSVNELGVTGEKRNATDQINCDNNTMAKKQCLSLVTNG